MALEADGSNPSIHPTLITKTSVVRAELVSGLALMFLVYYDGMSPRGKAKDFDSFIRGFESRHPSQIFPGYSVSYTAKYNI